MKTTPPGVATKLAEYRQEHLLQWWDELSGEQQESLVAQIDSVDFEMIRRVWQESKISSTAADSEVNRVDQAAAPKSVVLQPASETEEAQWEQAAEVGAQRLADGKVAVITVAGGQGSRLGFAHPKGMFPIGPISNRSLFQVFAEQILARKRRHGGDIPWLIMTSAATHSETIDFFEQHDFWGLDRETVAFFQQGSMPAVDASSGRVLMSAPDALCLSPDGHGGLVMALKSSGLLDRMASAGVEDFFYHQVDNPTVIMCDPALIGLHAQNNSQLTTCVVNKLRPTERMGVLVDISDHVEIIEYSELNEEQAAREDASGQWIFWAGNTAIHAFSLAFLEQLTSGGGQLVLHVAEKAVDHIDVTGNLIEPSELNANKFERFIFDALPLATSALIVEGNREREFNPVKNAQGNDSPLTSREALSRIGREWLSSAGHTLQETASVEISPLTALDADELVGSLKDGRITVNSLTGPPAAT
ncbi:MAG: UDPGP type 1 family protein [Fuerstiella sp.]|nr:UDPGP type 1 family protein [Fuerstiella sp.]MCP4854596.1 UDPGP type 1 family protein [Fuerstiella sp.]